MKAPSLHICTVLLQISRYLFALEESNEILRLFSPQHGDFIRLLSDRDARSEILYGDEDTNAQAKTYIPISFEANRPCTAAFYIDGIFSYRREVKNT